MYILISIFIVWTLIGSLFFEEIINDNRFNECNNKLTILICFISGPLIWTIILSALGLEFKMVIYKWIISLFKKLD